MRVVFHEEALEDLQSALPGFAEFFQTRRCCWVTMKRWPDFI
jgi:hypothetical protein